jgi:hypothetical protein
MLLDVYSEAQKLTINHSCYFEILMQPQINDGQNFGTGETYPLDAPGFLSNLATKTTCDLVDFLLNYGDYAQCQIL